MLPNNKFTSLEELKKYFREKVKHLHPDKGGSKEKFLEFISWYEETFKKLQTVSKVEIVKKCPLTGDYVFSILELSIEEIALGGKKAIKVPFEEQNCKECGGTGKNRKGKAETCGFCKGSGFIEVFDSRNERNTYLKCPYCKGLGYLFLEQCKHCFGKGKIREEKEIIIDLPVGLKEGDIIFASKEYTGAINDVYYEITIKPHPYFELRGNNIVYKCKIPFWEIILNEEITIRTLEGEEKVPSSLFYKESPVVLKERGPFLRKGGRGDFFIEFQIIVPNPFPKDAKEFIKKAVEILNKERR